ncbi:MAG: dihydrofolate reductase [Prevotella sp.]|nr:dihydrofolate reductase [Prevotella sp.]
MDNKTEKFQFAGERFADLQMLRYKLDDFESLTLPQKKYIYCLAKATLYGRDITFDQFGRYNLRIRKVLEAIYVNYKGEQDCAEYQELVTYLKQVWFSNGIYHHYGCQKFTPRFTHFFFRKAVESLDPTLLPLRDGETVSQLLDEIEPVIFNPDVLPKRVNKRDGDDLIATSACNYYENVSQKEVESFYAAKKNGDDKHPSWGLNSKLVKTNGKVMEQVWKVGGLYGQAISKIVYWLKKAEEYAESPEQKEVIELLVKYYNTGNLQDFDNYSIKWVQSHEGRIDFINGFIEVYGDPLALKGSWEGIVEYKDLKSAHRTHVISSNAQWFEDHSPIDPRFRKKVVKGVTANVVNAAMLGGDEYPSSAIGINLPNADWIRAEYGSKSVTISNLTHAYDMAAKGNGFKEEFVIDKDTLDNINLYGDACDDLHTDLHECLGHGSGKLLPGTDPDALKNYGNTIEEARADLFGLYYLADDKLLELGLLTSKEAYKAQYYTYMMNGLLTQMVRIKPGDKIEEAHMQNRALIARWALDLAKESDAVELVTREVTDKEGNKAQHTFVKINDYAKLRQIFAEELAEIQRIKSEGDFDKAKWLVEKYAINIDDDLHQEVLERYQKLNLAPYKGFINPWLKPEKNDKGEITDIKVDYTESYAHQMLRYSNEYATL